jgi:hypothetical protein
MTLKLTSSRTLRSEYGLRCKINWEQKMIYVVDERQLLRVWSVIRCFGEIREIKDPAIRSEVLTEAQILLTAFVQELQPMPH